LPKNSRFAAPADMAKLADAPDLGSGAARRVGSTPIIRTKGQSEGGFECEGGKYPHTQTQTHSVFLGVPQSPSSTIF
jgi:hypothetical protein